MTETAARTDSSLSMEIRASEWFGYTGEHGFKVPIQRNESGHLTQESRTAVMEHIRRLLGSHSPASCSCLCALGSGGLLLRTLELPSTKDMSLQNLIQLQIERDWPLSPDELAWGYQRVIEGVSTAEMGEGETTKVAVTALKRSLFQQYDSMLRECGLTPQWTISACAGTYLEAAAIEKACWIADVRETSTDLIHMHHGVPLQMHAIKGGWQDLDHAGENSTPQESPPSDGHPSAGQVWAASMVEKVRATENADALILTGPASDVAKGTRILEQAFGMERKLYTHQLVETEGVTLPTQMLHQSLSRPDGRSILQLKATEEAPQVATVDRSGWGRWVALLCLLAVVALLARRIEPGLRSATLDEQLQTFREQKKQLPEIDRELSFLEYLQQQTIPYMDLVSLLAAQSINGFQVESIEMGTDRRMQIKGTLPQNAHPEDLRANLLKTGWFEQVVLDEQTPDKKKRNLSVRISLIIKDHMKRPKATDEILGIKEDSESKESKQPKGK